MNASSTVGCRSMQTLMWGITTLLSNARVADVAISRRPADILDELDRRRLNMTVELSRLLSGRAPREILDPAGLLADDLAGNLDAHCRFAHVGLLVFPTTVAAGLQYLRSRRWSPHPPIPSVVVRHRLAERYRLDPRQCPVGVTRLEVPMAPLGRTRPAVELFLFGRNSTALTDTVISAERQHHFEEHIAFSVNQPAAPVVATLFEIFRGDCALLWEGGGYNPREGKAGSTVFYFIGAGHQNALIPRRIELHAEGDFRAILDSHPVDTSSVAARYREWAHHGR